MAFWALGIVAVTSAFPAPPRPNPAGASREAQRPQDRSPLIDDPRTVRAIAAVPAGGPIVIDGVLSESVWQTPGSGQFTQRNPSDGQPATEPTTVWIAFDRDNLYVAARLSDAEPGKIVGRLGRRDEAVESDWFDVGFDPYYDRRSGYYFGVNPSGSIEDGTLFNDEELDETWDGVWESAARIDDLGWSVEMRIPFDQLRFKRRDVQVWGVNFQRMIKRKNEEDHFAWVPKEQNGLVSRFADLTGLTGIASGRRLEISPFALSRAMFSPAVPGDPVPHRTRGRGERRLRPQGRPQQQPDPRSLGQPGFRAGRGRPGHHQHQRRGDVLSGEAPLLHRRIEHLQFRPGRAERLSHVRLGGPGPLL